MGNVVPFTGKCGKIYYPSREEVEVNGKARERWVVITRETNGEESYHPVKTKKDANWLANMLRENEVKRRSELATLESHPFGQTIMMLTPRERDLVRKIFEAEAHLRNT